MRPMRQMRLVFSLLALLAGCASGPSDGADGPTADEGALTAGTRHIPFGAPVDATPSDEYVLIHKQFVTSHNRFRNGANWVSWVVTKNDYGTAPRREGDFLTDDLLPADFYHVTHNDYSGSAWNRGHMVRSEERTDTVENNNATFLMTNVLPQRYELNIGPWAKFEMYCQHLVQREGRDLYLIAGGIWSSACKTDTTAEGNLPSAECETIGKPSSPQEHRVAVPDKFFKIAVLLPPGRRMSGITPDTRISAIVLDNQDPHIFETNWLDHLTTVDAIEELTGYDFLPKIEDALEATIESRIDPLAATAAAAVAAADVDAAAW